MKRSAMPAVSEGGQQALATYRQALQETTDISPTTVRNYLSDLRQFIAWCEAIWAAGQEAQPAFRPAALTTPLIMRYRSYLQEVQRLKSASVNRALVCIKRYVAWAVETGQVGRNPAASVKLLPPAPTAPRQLDDTEEEALVAAVTANGSLRDRTIIIVLLHTGMRAREVCRMQRRQVTIGRRSGVLQVDGKRQKQREIPLNATARRALTAYLQARRDDSPYLFPSTKTGAALSERALGHLIKKYARQAQLADVSPHDLRHRFGYRMAARVPLHRLAQIMGHDSLDTTLIYTQGTRQDLQREVEKIAWE